MSEPIEFEAFPKIPRYRREVALTEKIDGTNAAIRIRAMADLPESGSPLPIAVFPYIDQHGNDLGHHGIWAQSRSQFITPQKDNYGFAGWVQRHAEELVKLGPGIHFGEWWGSGIQRGYELREKRFSLFNVARWQPDRQTPPACCHVVPLIGYLMPADINIELEKLRRSGSLAAPGYMKPEGIIVWHSQSKQYYKVLIENDDIPKSQVGHGG